MKLVLTVISALLVVIVAALVAVFVFIDPNSFKPKIEALAQEQDIALDMKGEITWSFWPRLAFSLENVSVAPLSARDKPLAQFRQAALVLAIKPLLSGSIHIDEISLDGAQIYLHRDKNGKANWEALGKATASDAQSAQPIATQTPSAELNLAIERISVSDAALDFRDLSADQSFKVSKLNVDVTEVNTLGKPFQVAMSWMFAISQEGGQETLSLSGDMKSRMLFDKGFNDINVDKGELKLQFQHRESAQLHLQYSAHIENLKGGPQYQANIALESTNARAVLSALAVELDTADPQAFGRVFLRAEIKGDGQSIAFEPLTIGLDKTQINGNFSLRDFNTQAIEFSLKGNNINVDDYLPKPEDAPQEQVDPVAGEDTPLPLETMQALNIDGDLRFDSMIVQQIAVKNIFVKINAKEGLIKEDLRAQVYQGDIQLASTAKINPNTARLDFQGRVQEFQIEPLLNDMATSEGYNMSGAVDADLKGSSNGATVNQLLDQMNASLNFSGAKMRLSPLNIEEKFCKAVNLLSQKSLDVAWEDFTELREFTGSVIWKNNIIELSKFNAGVSQLLVASTGRINLKSEKYEFKLPLAFSSAKDAESYQPCSLSATSYWADRGLSLLRCKGSVANVDPLKDCGLDSEGLKSLSKDYAEYKLRGKYGDKIDAAETKLKDKKHDLKEKKQELKLEAREDADEKKTEVKEKLDEKKEELFNKLRKKLSKD